MRNIFILDTSIGSFNKGDDIIMDCTRKELSSLLKDNFELTHPTHVSPFLWYQVFRIFIIILLDKVFENRISSFDFDKEQIWLHFN